MARGDQLARQWAILMELTRGPRTRRALATRFEVSRKTITRDIEILSVFPIVETRDGIDVVYRCLPGFSPAQLQFEPREIAALMLARGPATAALAGLSFQAAFEAALDRVAAAVGPAHRRAAARAAVFRADIAPPTVRFASEERLLDAALAERRVRMRYRTAVRGTTSDRVVEPLCLHRHPYGLHLIAFCLRRGEIVHFNVNLIEAFEVLDERFERSAHADDVAAFLATGFDGHYSLPVHAVHLRIQPPSALWIRDRFFHPTQRVETGPDGVVDIHFEAGGTSAIVARVLGLGPACEVVSPPALRAAVAAAAREIAAQYAPWT